MADAGGEDIYPEPLKVDRADSVARALVSFIPGAGGPAATLVDLVITPPLERRREEWFNRVGARIVALEDEVEGFAVAALVEDEMFITAVTTASQIAVRNHSEEKLTALKNAVVSVALRTEPDVERQAVFLSLLDYLTPSHIRLLRFFQDPRGFLAQSGRGPRGAIGETTRDIVLEHVPGIPPDAYGLLCQDLDNRDLVDFPKPPTLGLTDERTTWFGDAFLRFISEQ